MLPSAIYQKPVEVVTTGQISGNYKVLEAIAYCESGNKHYKEDGSVITGRIDPRDTGKYQINTYYHQNTAEKMGLDLFNEQDNEAYAIWLYENQGTKPWDASKHCWDKMI